MKRGRKAGRDYSFVAVRQDSNKGSEATETKLKVDHTNSSSDYEIMITPRLWRKLLASGRKRKKSGRDYSFVAVGQDVKNVSKPTDPKSEEVQAELSEGAHGDYTDTYEEDDDDDGEIMITPRLWKKLQAAKKKRGKMGIDYNFDGQDFKNKSNGTKKREYLMSVLA